MAACFFRLLASMSLLTMLAFPAIANETNLLQEFRTHHMVIEALKVDNKIFAGVRTSRINVFDNSGKVDPSEILLPVQEGVWGPVPVSLFSMDVSPNKQILAVASNQGKLFLFQPSNNKLIKTLEYQGIDGLTAVRFVDDARFLMGTLGGEIVLSKIDGTIIYKNAIEYDAISRIAISPENEQYAVSSNASVIRVFEIESGELIQELKGHKDSVYDLVFIDEKTLISGGKDRRLLAWDIGLGTYRELYHSQSYIHSIALSKNLQIITFPVENHELGIMSWPSGKIIQRLKGHTAFVHSLRFVDEEKVLLSGGNDSRLRLVEFSK